MSESTSKTTQEFGKLSVTSGHFESNTEINKKKVLYTVNVCFGSSHLGFKTYMKKIKGSKHTVMYSEL